MKYQSWGRYPQARQTAIPVQWRSDSFPKAETSVLAYGRGRSYGDCCLNDGGTLLDTAPLDRYISFDTQRGILRAEAGVTLAQMIAFIVPHGWFLPVTPGTKYVSLGGAVANDVHGKNHHRVGTFGHHVRALELLRSDGTRLVCTPTENVDWFRATIGGMGLTGLILWIELQLKPIKSPFVDCEFIKFDTLDEFFALSADSDKTHEYTVAWVDAGPGRGRGLLMRANDSTAAPSELPAVSLRDPVYKMPVDAPAFLLNQWTVAMFNTVFFHKQWAKRVTRCVPYNPFFYPLDVIGQWNRLYGKRGFMQFQCVLPLEKGVGARVIDELLKRSAQSGGNSFLTVLKVFGNKPNAGMMSFPRPGVTITLDFPIHGPETFALLKEFDILIRENGGALYPAKDACMSAESFQQFYPRWKEFSKFVDPRFSSSFWRRVTSQTEARSAA
jgi:FAD/FMN-containing dehydrogenase